MVKFADPNDPVQPPLRDRPERHRGGDAGVCYPGANTWDLLLRTLAWPRWSLSGGRTALAHDLRALLLVVFVAAVLGMSAAALATGPGSFFIGWFAVILGGAVAALLAAFIVADASLYSGLQAAGSAAVYGPARTR